MAIPLSDKATQHTMITFGGIHCKYFWYFRPTLQGMHLLSHQCCLCCFAALLSTPTARQQLRRGCWNAGVVVVDVEELPKKHAKHLATLLAQSELTVGSKGSTSTVVQNTATVWATTGCSATVGSKRSSSGSSAQFGLDPALQKAALESFDAVAYVREEDTDLLDILEATEPSGGASEMQHDLDILRYHLVLAEQLAPVIPEECQVRAGVIWYGRVAQLVLHHAFMLDGC
jgi:hypothetical protein